MDDYSGVSVKVVNNELRIQRVDTGSLQKGSQSVRLYRVAVLYRGPWLRRAKIITVCFFATQSRSWKYRAADVDVDVY